MVADASIYGLIRPVQQGPGPLEQYGQMLTLRNLVDDQGLKELQRRKMENDFAEEAEFKSGLRNISDPTKPLPTNLWATSPTRAQAYEKSRLEGEKTRGEIGKTQADIMAKALANHREMLASVNDPETAARWVMAGYDNPVFGPLTAKIQASPQEVVAQIPRDPEGFRQWKLRNGLGIEKLMDAVKPDWKQRDIGGSLVPVQENPNAAGFNANQTLTKTMTPGDRDASARGWAGLNETARHNKENERRESDPTLQGRIAAERERGKAGAEAEIALPGVIRTAERGLRLIDEMIGTEGRKLKFGEKPVKPHPGFQGAVGATILPGARFVPGTDAADFQARMEEVKGGAFMEAFQNLRGGGQITEKEGEKATAAITRMSTSQSEAEFVKAAREFQDVIKTGLERARQKATIRPSGAPAAPAAPPSGGIKFLGFE